MVNVSLDRDKRNAHLDVTLDHSITGGCAGGASSLRVVDSIVDTASTRWFVAVEAAHAARMISAARSSARPPCAHRGAQRHLYGRVQ